MRIDRSLCISIQGLIGALVHRGETDLLQNPLLVLQALHVQFHSDRMELQTLCHFGQQ